MPRHDRYLLLTGATGLLGRFLVRDLQAAGRRVAILVRGSKTASGPARADELLDDWREVAGVSVPAPVVLEGDITLPGLGLAPAAYVARLVRSQMLEQMSAQYVLTARAKGLSTRQAALRHALRNAFLPVLSYLGPATAVAVTGSFVVEKVFAVPGIGKHFVDAVLAKDITLLMGVVLVLSTFVILLNLAVDVLYAWVDPRVTAGAGAR